jgi:autotransporter-associated beta strand protein
MLTHTSVRRAGLLVVLIAGIGWAGTGFAAEGEGHEKSKKSEVVIPRELAMRPLPTYRIEPPDILQIEITSSKAAGGGASQSTNLPEQAAPSEGADAVLGSSGSLAFDTVTSNSGEPTATINSGESLTNTGAGTLTISGSNTYSGTTTISGDSPPQTVSGWWTSSGDNSYSGGTAVTAGTIVLGSDASPTGTVRAFVQSGTPGPTGKPKFEKTVPSIHRIQAGAGQYLVGPDGTINLRQYGTVQVTGMTIIEAKTALEKHLSKYLESPEVVVEVLGYNSKVYYIITDGAGLGDNVRRIPICGKETVLDAVAAVGGLSQLSSKKMRLVRPSPTNPRKGTILPIDYEAITQRGATATNYQIMPGDRIFIAGDSVIALNNKLSKVTAPVERMMGIISLGASTIRSVKQLLPQQSHKEEYHNEDDY